MNTLALILLILFSGAIVAFLSEKVSKFLPSLIAFISITAAGILFYTSPADVFNFKLSLAGLNFTLKIDEFSRLFVHMIIGLSWLASMYAVGYMQNKERQGTFFFNMLLSIGGMLGIVAARDLVSFFVFWEIMTWSSFLIVVWTGADFRRTGIWYMVFSAMGAYAMLMAIMMIYSDIHTFNIDEIIAAIAEQRLPHLVEASVLLLFGFSVKAALMPLHVWAPNAYTQAPAAYTAIFSGVLSKMGIFGMALVLLSMLKFANPADFSLVYINGFIGQILAWLGAITAAIATLYALIQTDAKKLLAYSSVAQLGYITIGIAIGTPLSVMASLFLAVLHALFKGTLFLAMGAVERQAGTTDMTKISGLIRRMPWTFFVTLVSIISLAGVPPLAGFVGKWMLYEALITNGNVFMVVVVFFSSTAAFLYSYRILFGIFLGQEEDDTAHVKEAPLSMILPMVVMALLLIALGTYPGLLFDPIAQGMTVLGFENVTWQMTVLSNVWGNTVNLMYISTTIGVAFVAALLFLTLKGRKGSRNVGTKDISTSGEIPLEHENLTYQLDFFKPFERAASPLYRRKMTKIYDDLSNGLDALFDFTRKIYTGNGQTYALYVVIFLVALLIYVQNTL